MRLAAAQTKPQASQTDADWLICRRKESADLFEWLVASFTGQTTSGRTENQASLVLHP